MKRLDKPTVIATVTALLCLIATETFARGFYDEIRYNYGISRTEMGAMRVMMMVVSVGLGFGLGWFMSPQGKELRQVLIFAVAAILILFGIFNNSYIGWSAAWIVSVVGFFIAIGYWISTGLKSLGEVPTTFGSSRWATPDDLIKKKVFGPSGIRLGTTHNGQFEQDISYKGDSHMMTVAPTRTGKGTCAIIPNLLTYEGSTLVIDPKGENTMITAKTRKDMGQAVHIVDPWNIAQIDGIETARFNPMDWLQESTVDLAENCMILADALVVPSPNSEPFFKEEAKAYLVGMIGFVATDPDEEGQRNLGRVRVLCLLDGDDLTELYHKMMQSPHHFIASAGARSLQKDEKLLSNVLASVQSETHFLDSPRMRESLSASDFKFEDLKSTPMTIYLVLPADRLHPFARWLRLLIQQAITVNARNIAEKPEKPVLFILDEMAALGKLSMIEQAYGLMAGFGIQLWGIVQDFSQLESLYGKGWQSFVANTGMINYFGSTDRMTAEYFSALCGETTVWNLSSAISKAFGTSSGSGGAGSSSSITTTDRSCSK
ncbi:MAG: type IV secretory system conjugative DNA transfer family protein [Amylibacter sp.]|nr:type IV secretory system conjugative DNA transfer family protein [Amylibacter sp.]